MKKIKPFVFALFVMMAAMCLSACGTNRNAQNETSGSGTSMAPTTMGTTMESARSADENTTESTGVIDGMIHDVEKGVDDITGESSGQPTTALEGSTAVQ